jgi:hypothetical protein
MNFHKNEITDEWWDVVNQYPEFILDISPFVEEIYVDYSKRGLANMLPNREDMTNLRYGFECGVGWKDLILEFFQEVRNLINKAKDNGHEIHYKTFILKEKFGELREQGDFYGPDSKIYQDEFYKICDILDKSRKTCEVCGKTGRLVSRTYSLKTLCEDHIKEMGFSSRY